MNKTKINFYEETTSFLKNNGKNWDDIEFISISKDYVSKFSKNKPESYYIDVEDFISYIKEMYYNNGYGSNEVNLSIKIVGKDWWLERYEYDGAESWVYKEKPKKPEKEINLTKEILIDSGYTIRVNNKF